MIGKHDTNDRAPLVMSVARVSLLVLISFSVAGAQVRGYRREKEQERRPQRLSGTSDSRRLRMEERTDRSRLTGQRLEDRRYRVVGPSALRQEAREEATKLGPRRRGRREPPESVRRGERTQRQERGFFLGWSKKHYLTR